MRAIDLTLAGLIPLVTLSQLLQGLSDPFWGIIYNGTAVGLLAILFGLSYTRARRRPELLIFLTASVMIASLLFAAWHTTRPENPWAVFAFVVPLALAGFAPVRPTLNLLLGFEIILLYPISIHVAPYEQALPAWLAFSITSALTLMGAAACQVQRRFWAELDRARASAEAAQQLTENQLCLLERYAGDLEEARNAALAATRMKSEFLANMSHEIRTPMTAILGFADILIEQAGEMDLPKEAIDALATIRRNGEHLVHIINDILDLSKIEAGKLRVDRTCCSAPEIVAEVASLMSPVARKKELTLEVKYETPIPETIHSDPTRLRQILVNLVGNALKFTKRGGVVLAIRMLEAPDVPEPLLEIAVADTGIGLTEEQRSTVFDAFAQADGSARRRFGGTGLGLTIARHMAKLLGGDIAVASEPGRGSVFRVTLATGPLAGIPMLEHPPAGIGLLGEQGRARADADHALGGSILVAEDGPDNQRLLSAILAGAGLQVEIAPDGRAACETATAAAAAGEPFDVILMDMQMPELDGYGAVAQLRESGYTGVIVALTAHAMSGDREKCLAVGCNEYLTKPIQKRELLRVISHFLEKA